VLGTVAAATLVALAALAPDRRPSLSEERDRYAELSSGSGWKAAVDRFQGTRRPLAFVVGVVRKFNDDQAGKLAALIAYYGFFSLFPALLALTTSLGFVLERHPDLRRRIEDSALGQFPVIGSSIGSLQQPLSGNVFALVLGLLGAVWAGMGAIQAAQDAMNGVWDVARVDAPSFLKKRLRSLATLALIVVPLLANVIVPSLVGGFTGGVGTWVLVTVASLVVDVGVFAVAFRVLTAVPQTWRIVWPGACIAAVGYVLLQSLGALYVQHVLAGAEDTYGTFGVVIGLLSWMYLLARMVVLAAEVNVVRARRLWPRSLFSDPVTQADRRSQAAQAEEAEISGAERIDVSFDAGYS